MPLKLRYSDYYLKQVHQPYQTKKRLKTAYFNMATKKPIKKKSESTIISQIIAQTNGRYRQDLNTWRSAMQMAENREWPNRIALYNLHDEVDLDSHIHGLYMQRLNKLLGCDHRVVKADGKEVEEASNIFKKAWFYKFLSAAFTEIKHGHALIQLWDATPEGYATVELVPRRHVIPEYQAVSKMQGDYSQTDVIYYTEPPYADWLVEVGEPRNLGLYTKAAPSYIIKKYGLLQWSEYAEVFGMPLRVGYTQDKTEAGMRRMATNLQKIGTSAYGVFLEGEKVEFVESKRTDAFNVYDKLIERCNSELSKLFVGQTMTTDNGSSKSQAEVHERVADSIADADKRNMAFVINSKLLPLMAKHGYPVEGLKFEWDNSNKAQLLDTTIKLLTNYDVPTKWIEENFGVPVVSKISTSTSPVQVENPPANPPAGGNKPDPKPKKKSLIALIDAEYSRRCTRCKGLVKLSNNTPAPLSFDTEAFLDYVFAHDGNTVSTGAMQAIHRDLWDNFKAAYEGYTEHPLAAVTNRNLLRFSAAKTLTLQSELQALKEPGMSRSQFGEAAKQTLDKFNGAWREVEVNHSIASAQTTALWDSFKANADLYPHWKLQTAGDARVRDSHAILDGITLSLTDSLTKKFWPPLDWNCRCTAQQTDEDVTTNAATQITNAKLNPAFSNNTGATGIVFKEDHTYFKGGNKKVVNELIP